MADVREQGLTMLALRLVNMSTTARRRSMDHFMDKWIAQVKAIDLALETATQKPVRRFKTR